VLFRSKHSRGFWILDSGGLTDACGFKLAHSQRPKQDSNPGNRVRREVCKPLSYQDAFRPSLLVSSAGMVAHEGLECPINCSASPLLLSKVLRTPQGTLAIRILGGVEGGTGLRHWREDANPPGSSACLLYSFIHSCYTCS